MHTGAHADNSRNLKLIFIVHSMENAVLGHSITYNFYLLIIFSVKCAAKEYDKCSLGTWSGEGTAVGLGQSVVLVVGLIKVFKCSKQLFNHAACRKCC